MKTIRTKVYQFDELNETAKEKAIVNQLNFEIEIGIDEDSPYYPAVVKMDKMQTPWFLAETLFFDYKETLIDTIKANEYYFLQDGTFASPQPKQKV